MNSVLKLKTGDLVKLRNDKGWYTVIENQDSHPPTSLIVAFKDAGHMDLDDYNENGVFGKYFEKL